ncbi:Hypothetical protein SRAE_2000383200 [Strongyloides ratti]|uniref:Uncharacterized protein n=1 Tax=Strongyloides ratti TaxID=34506 RepID=A0A090LHG6_STRRB|nr:Hypothetical protein SRAE_2000383200 [Strongyloides ratti]CEF69182.1 Hypothetical protein SRAE_2000383200 [Strongyloides ratti]
MTTSYIIILIFLLIFSSSSTTSGFYIKNLDRTPNTTIMEEEEDNVDITPVLRYTDNLFITNNEKVFMNMLSI